MSGFFEFLTKVLPLLLDGVVVTIELTAVSTLLGFLAAIPLSVCRTYGRGLLKSIAVFYIEIIRGTPLLVQVLLIWYGMPGLGLPRFWAAVLALTINSSAYQAEYFRSAIQSIDSGQMMAARSLGMSHVQAVTYIIIPQALRRALPALGNEVAYMLKYTSIVFIIAVPELMARGRMAISWYFKPIETWLIVALIYIILVNTAAGLMQLVERKWRIPGESG